MWYVLVLSCLVGFVFCMCSLASDVLLYVLFMVLLPVYVGNAALSPYHMGNPYVHAVRMITCTFMRQSYLSPCIYIYMYIYISYTSGADLRFESNRWITAHWRRFFCSRLCNCACTLHLHLYLSQTCTDQFRSVQSSADQLSQGPHAIACTHAIRSDSDGDLFVLPYTGSNPLFFVSMYVRTCVRM